jgi:hypothetical protein
MNDHFEELIHDSIDQLTIGSTLPAGLADRARWQVRRRQYQLRAAAAAGTAAAAAIAVIAATSAGSAGTTPKSSAGPRPSPSVALLAKIERAIASKAASAPVLQIKTTFPTRLVPMPADPFSQVQAAEGGIVGTEIVWTRGNVLKLEVLDPKGQIMWIDRDTDRRMLGPGTYTHVDYLSRYWFRGQTNGFVYKKDIPRCTVLPLGPGEPQEWAPRTLAKEIRHALACGRVKVAGRQHVDGVEAIKLAFPPGLVHVNWHGIGPGRAVAHAAMWIDADSYLPLRYKSTLTLVDAKPGSGHPSAALHCDFQWLPATSSALAKLRLTIPSGFHHDQPKTVTVHVPAPHK